VVYALALLAVIAGCGRRPIPPPPEPDIMNRPAYVIGPADLLSIRVWKNPELSLDQVPVRPDGKISVPLVNDVQAAGLTTLELKDVLTKALAEYVTNPEVTVVVVQMNSRKVFVLGEVTKPGPIPLVEDLRVLDAISAAGGFTTFADKRHVKVIRRQADGTGVEYRFNYNSYVSGGDPLSNLLLQNGDTIVVPD
jgi:polysaccharide export outer membrane protein